jgi:hypothetical protein
VLAATRGLVSMARSASGWMSGYAAATVHMAVQKVSVSPGYRQARGKLISEKADNAILRPEQGPDVPLEAELVAFAR